MRNARRAPPQGLHSGGQSSHELIIVVGIQNIVFAIVLGLRDQIGVLEALGEICARALALRAAAIGITAPVEINLGDIATIVPAALVDQGLQPRAIGARLRAEYTIRRPALRLLATHATGFKRLPSGAN